MSVKSFLSLPFANYIVLKNKKWKYNAVNTQSKVFKKILSKYNPKLKKLIDTKASRAEINKLTKLEVLEIYDLLTSEQFKKYKEVRKSLEKNKHYRK